MSGAWWAATWQGQSPPGELHVATAKGAAAVRGDGVAAFDAGNRVRDILSPARQRRSLLHAARLIRVDPGASYAPELKEIGDTLIVPLTMYFTRFDSLDMLKETAGEKAR